MKAFSADTGCVLWKVSAKEFFSIFGYVCYFESNIRYDNYACLCAAPTIGLYLDLFSDLDSLAMNHFVIHF